MPHFNNTFCVICGSTKLSSLDFLRLATTVLLTTVFLIGALAVSQKAFAQYTQPCTLIWSDEFDGSTLNLNNWEYQYGDGTAVGLPGGWGNNELQYYTDTQATVAGGFLTIRAERAIPAIAGRNFKSSRIRSIYKRDTAYGRYEVRLKLPANQGASGQGTWPAVWLLNSDPNSYGNWPASGEIDIVEWLGHDPRRIYGTMHYGNIGDGSANNGNDPLLPVGTTNDFHTYAVEWDLTEVRWYLNGVQYHSVNSATWFSNGSTNPNAPFDTAFHWILNVAVGGNFPGNPNGNSQYPQDLIVDYVRHYELSTTPTLDTTPDRPTLVFENFEDNNPFDWNTFGSPIGGGGIGNNVSDTPPGVGGNYAMDTGWGGGGPGFYGVFQWVNFGDLSDMTEFSFWINPDGRDTSSGSINLNQDYTLEINIQDDDTGDGIWQPSEDDEFQYSCRVSPNGPCAVVGGGWQRVTIPMSDFVHDTSFATGGTGILDTAPGENGVMHNMTVAVISNNGQTVNFDTDFWLFEGEPFSEVAEAFNIPIMLGWMHAALASIFAVIGWRVRRN